MRIRRRLTSVLITAAAFAAFVHPSGFGAQSKVGDKKAAFDIRRFSPTPPGTFETFYVTETQSLKEALDRGSVKEDMRLLVTETAAGKLALLTDQMAYHHIAEGNAGGKDWMVSF